MQQDPLLHMSMIYPIQCDTVEFIYAEEDGVFFKHPMSNAYMISTKTFELGKKLIDSVGTQDLYLIHQRELADYIMEQLPQKSRMDCVQAVYEKSEPVMCKQSLVVKTLGLEYLELLNEKYNEGSDDDYIKRRLEANELLGGFKGGDLCGFVGYHEDGGIGLLQVFEEFRGNGYGEELSGFLINHSLASNRVPYGQIKIGNEVSLNLHKKLGLSISENPLFWIF